MAEYKETLLLRIQRYFNIKNTKNLIWWIQKDFNTKNTEILILWTQRDFILSFFFLFY